MIFKTFVLSQLNYVAIVTTPNLLALEQLEWKWRALSRRDSLFQKIESVLQLRKTVLDFLSLPILYQDFVTKGFSMYFKKLLPVRPRTINYCCWKKPPTFSKISYPVSNLPLVGSAWGKLDDTFRKVFVGRNFRLLIPALVIPPYQRFRGICASDIHRKNSGGSGRVMRGGFVKECPRRVLLFR
jgi:hypothetical protein